jgi:hypothetical protein
MSTTWIEAAAEATATRRAVPVRQRVDHACLRGCVSIWTTAIDVQRSCGLVGIVAGLSGSTDKSYFQLKGWSHAEASNARLIFRPISRTRKSWSSSCCRILDGDLGPYDTSLEVRPRAADTIVVLDFTFTRCTWRTLRRGCEQAEYRRWVRAYRRRSLPDVMRAISSEATHSEALRPAQSRHGAALRRRSSADSRARTPQRVTG